MTKSKIARADFYRQKRKDLLKSIEGVAYNISGINNVNEQTEERLSRYFGRLNNEYKWLGTTFYYNPTTDEIFCLYKNDLSKGFDYKIYDSDNWYLRKINNLPPPKLRQIGPLDELVSDFTDVRKWFSYFYNSEMNTIICSKNFFDEKKSPVTPDEDCYLRKLNNLPPADSKEEYELRKQKIEAMNDSLMKSIDGIAIELQSFYDAGSRYFYNQTTNKIFALHRYAKGFEENVTRDENRALREWNKLSVSKGRVLS